MAVENLHKNIPDAQIHVPKGFVDAGNNTRLTKDSTGGLSWVDDVSTASNQMFFQAASKNATNDTARGAYLVAISTNNNQVYISGFAPDDFSTLVSAEVVGICGFNNNNADIDFLVENATTGSPSEQYDNHSNSDITSTYDFTNNRMIEMDITSLFVDLEAGDYFGVEVHNRENQSFYCIGLKFIYTV